MRLKTLWIVAALCSWPRPRPQTRATQASSRNLARHARWIAFTLLLTAFLLKLIVASDWLLPADEKLVSPDLVVP
jgi:hypothetical protein